MQSTAMDCGIAVGGLALALATRRLLDPLLGNHQSFNTFFLSVFFAAWIGGAVPGIVALLLGALAGEYFFAAPRHSFAIHNFNEVSAMALYLIVGLASIAFVEFSRVAQRRAELATVEAERRQAALEREVAERRAAETSLAASEARFRRLSEANILGIVSFNADGRIEQANDEFLRMIGFIDERTTTEHGRIAFEAAALTVRDLSITSEPTADDLAALEQLTKTGACAPFEKELLHRDKTTRVPVMVGGARFRADRSGTIAFVLDQTAKRQARDTMQMQSRVLESMVEGVIVSDAGTGEIVFTNQSLDDLLGYSRNALVRANVNDLSAANDEARAELTEEIDLALRVRGSWSGSLPFRRKDQSVAECETVISAMRLGDRDYRIFVQQDAMERHRAAQAVEAAEERLALAMQAAAMGTWELDPATDQLKASSQLRAIRDDLDQSHGRPHAHDGDTIPMSAFYDALHPDDRDSVRDAVRDALAGENNYDVEFRCLRPDGSVRWFSAQAKIFRDNSGNALRMTGVTLDVTDRHEAERALRISEERFRLAADAVEAAIYDWDVAADTTFRSNGLQKLLGFTPAEAGVDGAWWPARIHPDDAPEAIRVFTEKLGDAESSSYESEYRIQHNDGRWVDVWDCGLIVRDATGQPTRVVGSAVDISDRKHAEHELRESEERFRQFADNTREVLWIHDARDGHLEYVSPAYEAVWGRSRVTLLGREDTWQETIHPTDRAIAMSSVGLAVSHGESSVEYRVVRPDGSTRWVHDRGFAIRDENGQVVRVAGIARDITESRAAQEESRLAKETAEAADRAKDDFLAALSHELRTPLTPVLALVQMMRGDQSLSESTREDLDMICRNIELEARLIDDLLDLTRVARGKIDLQITPCDANALVRRAVEICRSEADQKHLEISLELNAVDCYVMADGARLQQVAWNLVKNAIKFTPGDHGGRIIVRSACRDDGNSFELEVIDNGIGMEPVVLERIFNAFEQGAPDITRRFGGLGLGLTISKALVDLHGGELHARSDGDGRGSTFTLLMPAHRVTAEDRLDAPSVPFPLSENQNGVDNSGSNGEAPKRLRILLVEDHVDTARIVQRVLTQDGFDVTTAGSRGQALQIAAENEFDLIISDIGLPDGSGLNLIRELSANRPVKGIALSGFGMEHDIERSRDAGFAEHLTKPVDISRLEAAIRRVAEVE